MSGRDTDRRNRYVVAASLLLLATAMAAHAESPEPPIPSERLSVRVQAILVSDDDGARQARCNPEHMTQWIKFANNAFRSANIRFVFRPKVDWVELRNTTINNMTGAGDGNWREARDLANQIAAEYPDRLVVFIRHGPGDRPSGSGFSWRVYDFVVVGGFEDMNHCGHPHLDVLAHEIGHYLGLMHTFGGDPVPDVASAEERMAENGDAVRVFDGDGLADTPPDPGISSTECDDTASVKLQGIEYRLPRTNLMSYYDERESLSPLQIDRARWMLRKRMANAMATPKHPTNAFMIEAEKLRVSSRRQGFENFQDMEQFGMGNWSGGAQRYCGATIGTRIAFDLPAPQSQQYELNLYATSAPNFGIITCAVDNSGIGDAIDLYSPFVLPTGKIKLGTLNLSKGIHEISFTVDEKNSKSEGYSFGIDAIELKPI